MLPKNKIKIPLSFVVFFVLVTFTIPIAVYSGGPGECPCFTRSDVMRFTPPSPLTCIWTYDFENLHQKMRLNQSGEYQAYFSTYHEVLYGYDNMYCEAWAFVGDEASPQVVLLGDEYGNQIHIDYDGTCPECFAACEQYLMKQADHIGECEF